MLKDKDSVIENFEEEIKKPKITTRVVDEVILTFRENRKYDLHVGREMITFRGRETKRIPKNWIDHKDFENVKKLFIINKILGGKKC